MGFMDIFGGKKNKQDTKNTNQQVVDPAVEQQQQLKQQAERQQSEMRTDAELGNLSLGVEAQQALIWSGEMHGQKLEEVGLCHEGLTDLQLKNDNVFYGGYYHRRTGKPVSTCWAVAQKYDLAA